MRYQRERATDEICEVICEERPSRIEVRRAQESDIPWLMDQLKAFDRFFEAKRPLYGDESQVKESLSRLLTQQFIEIAESELSGPMGFIVGVKCPHLFNPKLTVATELFWWVDPIHRGSRAGLMLLNSFMTWAKDGSDWVIFTLEDKSPVSDRALLKRGFKLKERNYLLEVS